MVESTNRKYFVGGNWKCNGTQAFAKDLVENVLNKAEYNHDKVGKYLQIYLVCLWLAYNSLFRCRCCSRECAFESRVIPNSSTHHCVSLELFRHRQRCFYWRSLRRYFSWPWHLMGDSRSQWEKITLWREQWSRRKEDLICSFQGIECHSLHWRKAWWKRKWHY